MSNFALIAGGVALAGIAYYSYKRKKAKEPRSIEEFIECFIRETNIVPEEVESLSKADVVAYFKSFSLKKGVDSPFIYRYVNNEKEFFMMAIIDDKYKIDRCKLLSAKGIDSELIQLFGEHNFVILN